MPIISTPDTTTKSNGKCKCKPPLSTHNPGASWCSVYHKFDSQFPTNTIWECADCGTYAFTSKKSGTGGWKFWIQVRWYHFNIRREIERVKSESQIAGGVL